VWFYGPYWYAYWREGSRLRSGYVGKMSPSEIEDSSKSSQQQAVTIPSIMHERIEEAVLV